ncbi:MAG TPA: YbaK/EbsC family protein [Candidatus Limadaptatus stercoravium]|nr:YbaK/EbsC family protein [Candidatus Limadaptatus stercoravium]
MSIQKVREYLAAYGAADRIREFDVSSATVELAAKALGCAESRIAKTLSFMLGDRVVLVVAAGDVKVDNRKYKDFFGGKAKMLAREDAERLTGHAVGGVCPFAVNDGVEVWLDESLKRFGTVFPACGSASSAIELTLDELEKFSRAKGWTDVCKPCLAAE